MKCEIFNEWEIIENIGNGGFGTVYKIKKSNGEISALKKIDLPVSLKKVNFLIHNGIVNDKTSANVFYEKAVYKEVEMMKKYFNSPYIIDFFEFYQTNRDNNELNKNFYIRMEYAKDLRTYFEHREISIDEIIKIGIDICSALELLGSDNYVHNDIKPSNIFVGINGKYKLGDFGISSLIGENNNVVFGTFNYLSPEVYKKEKVCSSTDLYSLGLVLYKLINGELPFVDEKTNELEAFNIRMSGRKIPEISELNTDLMKILYKACAYSVIDRYSTPSEMKKELLALKKVNWKKKIIKFGVSHLEATLSIYDEGLLAKRNNQLSVSDKVLKKNKTKKFNIKIIKKVIFSSVFVIIGLFMIGNFFFNRNCEMGFINKNGRCVKGYYFCEDGYSLNAENKCQKTIESVDAKITYICKSGYMLNGDVCVNTDVKEPEFVYKCVDGFKLNGKKCEKVESVDAVVTYSCPSGYIAAGDQCVTVTNIDATSKYVCVDSSYILSGSVCTKKVSKTVKASIDYSCDANGTLNGTICNYTIEPTYSWFYYSPKCNRGTYNYVDKKCHYSESAKINYVCATGESDGKGNCNYVGTDRINASIEYSCPSGYAAVGSQCAKTTGIAGTPKYVCSDGTKLKGKKCYATISTDAVGMYGCPDGYVASGASCYMEDFPKAIKKYTCSRVYTLNGGKCEKYDIIEAKEYFYD